MWYDFSNQSKDVADAGKQGALECTAGVRVATDGADRVTSNLKKTAPLDHEMCNMQSIGASAGVLHEATHSHKAMTCHIKT